MLYKFNYRVENGYNNIKMLMCLYVYNIVYVFIRSIFYKYVSIKFYIESLLLLDG